MGSVSMPPYAVLSFGRGLRGVYNIGTTEGLPSVYCVTIECPPEAIHEQRYIERPKTTRVTTCFNDALPEERRPVLVVVEVIYALEYGKFCGMLRK